MKKKLAAAQFHRRRYYLHNFIRHKLSGKYHINADTREVDITPYGSFEEIPVPDRYYIGQLIKSGYNIQLKLF